jgi:hypothetical protein
MSLGSAAKTVAATGDWVLTLYQPSDGQEAAFLFGAKLAENFLGKFSNLLRSGGSRATQETFPDGAR